VAVFYPFGSPAPCAHGSDQWSDGEAEQLSSREQKYFVGEKFFGSRKRNIENLKFDRRNYKENNNNRKCC
jgi:hypothetical protein